MPRARNVPATRKRRKKFLKKLEVTLETNPVYSGMPKMQ